jgi:hypothetical protein
LDAGFHLSLLILFSGVTPMKRMLNERKRALLEEQIIPEKSNSRILGYRDWFRVIS